MAVPGDFFTTDSMLTLAGATAITTLVTNVCQYTFNWNPKWLGLIIGIVIGLIGAAVTPDAKWVNYVMGFINGFLIYASATGIMQMSGKAPDPHAPGIIAGQAKRTFWGKWF